MLFVLQYHKILSKRWFHILEGRYGFDNGCKRSMAVDVEGNGYYWIFKRLVIICVFFIKLVRNK